MIERPIQFTSTNLVVNKRADSNLSSSPFYWIPVRKVDGYYGDELRYESHPITGADGERSSLPLKSAKQLVLTGEVRAANLYMLRYAQEALQQALWSGAKFNLLYHTWISYTNAGFTDSTGRLYFRVRVNQPLVMVDEITEYQYRMNWTVGLKADDPRVYSEATSLPYFAWQT